MTAKLSNSVEAASATPRVQEARRLGAVELIELIADSGSYRSWDAKPLEPNLGEAYATDIQEARQRSGVDESVITGEARVDGQRVVFIACEFRFLAGSIGVAAAERIVTAFERATKERLPVFASVASGGTRMQEGTLAFVAMVKIVAAVAAHKAASLPYLVYLRHPSTGGALASFGSLGQMTVAEPGALVGFLGPRVYQALHGSSFPENVQLAENLAQHGVIDGVLAPADLRSVIRRLLVLLRPPSHRSLIEQASAAEGTPEPVLGRATPWESITRTRDLRRPGLHELLKHSAADLVPLSGTGQGERDPGLSLSLARFGKVPCVVVGQDRRMQRARAPFGPGGLRAARRAIRLSRELQLPLVTVIDTPGAALSRAAEEGGLAHEIAQCLADLVAHECPTLSVVLGEGTGGGALALLPADRTVAAEHAWLSPLPPEGAAAIVHRDPERAAELAMQQGVASHVLRAHGIVDRIVAECPDAAQEPREFSVRMGKVISGELAALSVRQPDERLMNRLRRYRQLGF